MQQVQPGDTVKVNYSVSLGDGIMLADTTRDRNPTRFTVGIDEPFPSLDRVVVGMKEGEFRLRKIPADEVFAEKAEDLAPLLPTKKDLERQDVVFAVWLIDSH